MNNTFGDYQLFFIDYSLFIIYISKLSVDRIKIWIKDNSFIPYIQY